jgi:hypothetical protein
MWEQTFRGTGNDLVEQEKGGKKRAAQRIIIKWRSYSIPT